MSAVLVQPECASHDCADKSPYLGVYHRRPWASLLAVAREVTIKIIAGWIRAVAEDSRDFR